MEESSGEWRTLSLVLLVIQAFQVVSNRRQRELDSYPLQAS